MGCTKKTMWKSKKTEWKSLNTCWRARCNSYSIPFNLYSSPGFITGIRIKENDCTFSLWHFRVKNVHFFRCFIQNWEEIESLKNEKSPGIVLEKSWNSVFPFLYEPWNKMLVLRTAIHKMLVRVANMEDPDQTASSEAVWSGSALFV